MMLNPTPRDRMVDSQGRPYFLWDNPLTLAEFEALLADPDPEVRGYAFGVLMRQAKPDDVFMFVTAAQIVALWPHIARYLGDTRGFWTWLIAALERLELVDR